jgi:hypothetical protein
MRIPECARFLLAAVVLAGCAGQQQQLTAQPLTASDIAVVQSEIKRQIGLYMIAAQQPPLVAIGGTRRAVTADDLKCGNGSINFDISQVKAELLTTIDNTTDFKLGLKIPIHLGAVSPSGEYKNIAGTTQTLTYNLWPLADQSKLFEDLKQHPISSDDLQKRLGTAPIATTLLNLREALVLGAVKRSLLVGTPPGEDMQPCFWDFNPEKPSSDAGNSFKLGLNVTHDATIGLSISAMILTAGATGESKSVTGNTLTVMFVQSRLKPLQKLRDEMDAACKPPAKKNCKEATEAYNNALQSGEGIGVLKKEFPTR